MFWYVQNSIFFFNGCYIFYLITMTRKLGKHLHTTNGTAFSTLLDHINSAYRDLNDWRSNQQPH